MSGEPAETSPLATPPSTRLATSFVIAPLGDMPGNVATAVAEALLVLMGMFFPPVLCRKANIVVTELVQNVMENVSHPESEIVVALSVDAERLQVRVTNAVSPEQHAAVAARIQELSSAEDPKKLFAQTLRARRTNRQKGGIGLMRLVSENRFKLGSEYDGAKLTVSAEFALNAKGPE